MIFIQLQTTPFEIPDNISYIPTFIFTGVTVLYSLAVIYLYNTLKELKKELSEKEKEHAKDIADHIEDLKQQREKVQNITDKKTNIVLTNLEQQITKLEIILSTFKKE